MYKSALELVQLTQKGIDEVRRRIDMMHIGLMLGAASRQIKKDIENN